MFGMQALGDTIGPATGGACANHFALTATFYFLALTIVIANMFIFFTPVPNPEQRPQLATA
jgi:FSR family fosmidomycin resistance protein-like MFS transporter